jgi:hypothetical protein
MVCRWKLGLFISMDRTYEYFPRYNYNATSTNAHNTIWDIVFSKNKILCLFCLLKPFVFPSVYRFVIFFCCWSNSVDKLMSVFIVNRSEHFCYLLNYIPIVCFSNCIMSIIYLVIYVILAKVVNCDVNVT